MLRGLGLGLGMRSGGDVTSLVISLEPTAAPFARGAWWPATCWRRRQEWQDAGIWFDLWRKLLGELDEKGILSRDETFSDGTFSPADQAATAHLRHGGR